MINTENFTLSSSLPCLYSILPKKCNKIYNMKTFVLFVFFSFITDTFNPYRKVIREKPFREGMKLIDYSTANRVGVQY